MNNFKYRIGTDRVLEGWIAVYCKFGRTQGWWLKPAFDYLVGYSLYFRVYKLTIGFAIPWGREFLFCWPRKMIKP